MDDSNEITSNDLLTVYNHDTVTLYIYIIALHQLINYEYIYWNNTLYT